VTAIEKLRTLIAEVMDLRHSADLIEWDERVYMPPGGVTVHGEMSAALRRLAHEKFTSDDVGKALDAARADVAGEDPDSTAARMVAVVEGVYGRATPG
jgi:carboxypeptidase Taq